jgi:predicted ATPase
MKLSSLKAVCYRSLRDETIPFGSLNLFIGTNASGKSTVLDALRFLHDAVQERDFRPPTFSRGGILNLAWKGEDARKIELLTKFEDQDKTYEWKVQLTKEPYEFSMREDLSEIHTSAPPTQLLSADRGRGWWWSGQKGEQVPLAQETTTCALASAAADESFPARGIAEFVGRWGFFDPNPFLLRRGWSGFDPSRFDPYGRNLAERLFAINQSSPAIFNQIVSATKSVLGLPVGIEPRESDNGFYFVQTESGLNHTVHQMGVSSGTLRMLALMTALFGESGTNLIGIEEPENNIHPTALTSFAEYLLKVRERVQILVTTHSSLLLDFLNEPAAVSVVRHTDTEGTRVTRETNPDAVREALNESGFGLGEFYETKGFGG